MSLLGTMFGLDLASNLFNTLTGGGANYMMQSKLMDKQFELQKQMQDRTNEYNKPINQVARLREAGINPNLALGSVNSVSGSSLPSVGAGHAAAPASRLDLAGQMMLSQQVRGAKADADLTEAKVYNQVLENERLEKERPFWEQNAAFRSDTLKWLNMSSENRAKNDEINRHMNQIILDAQTGGTHQYPDLGIDDSRDTPLYRATVDKLTREGLTNDEIDARIDVLNKRLDEMAAHIDLMKKQGKNLDIRSELLQLEETMKESLGVSYNDDLGWRLLARVLGKIGVTPEKVAELF